MGGDDNDDFLRTVEIAQALLIRNLERARKSFNKKKKSGKLQALQAVYDFVAKAMNVPPALLRPLLELIGELGDAELDVKSKPAVEAMELARASAAITLAKRAGETIGTARNSEPGPTAIKAARIIGGKTGKELISHRDNLISGRGSDIGLAVYKESLLHAESRTDLTENEKVEAMLFLLRRFT